MPGKGVSRFIIGALDVCEDRLVGHFDAAGMSDGTPTLRKRSRAIIHPPPHHGFNRAAARTNRMPFSPTDADHLITPNPCASVD